MTIQTATDAPPKSLREAIARSQLTTEQIVAKVGCTRRSLANWKRGVRPRDYYIGRLSTVLNSDLWSLYTREKNTLIVDSGAPGFLAEVPRLSGPTKELSVPPIAASGHQQLDRIVKDFAHNQIQRLWDHFHTMEETVGPDTLRLAAHSYSNMLESFTQWPLADADRTWLLQALTDGALLAGRLARDQMNYQEAIRQHKNALALALESRSSDHVVAAAMRLAETLWEAGLTYEATAYCKAGIDASRNANQRVRGELLGYAAEVYSAVGDWHESERLVNEAAELAIGAVQYSTPGGINFSETAAAEYLANEALRRGDVGAALAHIQRARRLLTTEFPTGRNVRWQAHLLLDQARVQCAASDFEAACNDVEHAIQLAHQIASHITIRKAHDVLQDATRQQHVPRALVDLRDDLLRQLVNGQ